MTTFFVHFAPHTHVLCGLPGNVCSDNPADVTCPLCQAILQFRAQMEAVGI